MHSLPSVKVPCDSTGMCSFLSECLPLHRFCTFVCIGPYRLLIQTASSFLQKYSNCVRLLLQASMSITICTWVPVPVCKANGCHSLLPVHYCIGINGWSKTGVMQFYSFNSYIIAAPNKKQAGPVHFRIGG